MYNSIYPININYRNNPYRNAVNNNNNSGNNSTLDNQNNNPKPQNPYPSSGQINISQVLADFKNTIIAINAPDDIKEEVELYLGLVERESNKQNPSRDIIIANLKNASRISDNYIGQILNKKSNVVEGWITTLFQQQINLKADPNEINPDFLLKFPQKAQEKIDQTKAQENIDQTKTQIPQTQDENPAVAVTQEEIKTTPSNTQPIDEKSPDVKSSIELSKTKPKEIKIKDIKPSKKNPSFIALTEADIQAKNILAKTKKLPDTAEGDTTALKMLNEALGLLSQESNGNKNIKAALHLQRGKIFNNYDYVDYALRDFIEATKADDLNLKAQSFYKLAEIYDEFKKYSPALENYLSSVAYSGEAENLKAQAGVLSKIAGLYTKQYDLENTINYTDIAIETALNTDDNKTIAKTYSTGAQNFQYLGENELALENYKNALQVFYQDNESWEEMAYNYSQASIVMERLGNYAKAKKLQDKADLYRQKAEHIPYPQEAVS